MPSTTASLMIFSVDSDSVVQALVASGRTTYEYALSKLVPLIDRLEIQRRIQNPRFYQRLERDLLKGCLMPPITIAFVHDNLTNLKSASSFKTFLVKNIDKAFVLDGIQRLSTLKRAYEQHGKKLNLKQPVFINVLICSSMDNLLYRMITLNNGQRPMTTRHQIEILSANMFDSVDGDIVLSTEKAGKRKVQGIFARSDFVLGYMAFLSNSTTVDSQKLIEEKLDELVANKILEHDPTTDTVQFNEVTNLIGKLCESNNLDKWFKISNNLIGFCAGIRQGFNPVSKLTANQFAAYLDSIEEAIRAFDISKVKLGRVRRLAIAYCIRNTSALKGKGASTITEKLVEYIEQ